jgi:hypothetical protein
VFRPGALLRGAIVVAIAFSAMACAGRASVPNPPLRYPGPTPAVPSIDPGRPYAEALVAALASDPLVLHAVQTTKAKAAYGMDSVKLDTTMTMDLSDRDHHMRLVSKTPAGKTVKTDLIVVGKSAFSRIGGAKWTKSLRTDYERTRTDIVRAFQLVRNPSLLRYVGLETVDRRKLHHLTAVQDLPFVAVTGMTGTYTRFDVWIEEDGTPVLVKAKFTTVVDYGIEITGNSEMRISKFGGPIKIVAPKN